MEMVIKIQMTDLLFIKDKSSYNKECYELMPTVFGCDFLLAKYDDVNDDAYIEIGHYEGGRFISKIQGYSGQIDKNKIGFGGVYVEVDVIRPDLTLDLKTK